MKGIVLDTNVISEPRRPLPDSKVRAWFEAQDVEQLYLTATVIGDLALGIERMPKGRRRTDFDALSQGRSPTVGDAQIAAVAWRDGMTVATRDVTDFEPLGVPIIDPWQGA